VEKREETKTREQEKETSGRKMRGGKRGGWTKAASKRKTRIGESEVLTWLCLENAYNNNLFSEPACDSSDLPLEAAQRSMDLTRLQRSTMLRGLNHQQMDSTTASVSIDGLSAPPATKIQHLNIYSILMLLTLVMEILLSAFTHWPCSPSADELSLQPWVATSH